MFRAAMFPSSGELIVLIRHLVYVTLYRWPFGVQAKPEKELSVKLVIYKDYIERHGQQNFKKNTTLFVSFIKKTLSWGFLKMGSILLSPDVITLSRWDAISFTVPPWETLAASNASLWQFWVSKQPVRDSAETFEPLLHALRVLNRRKWWEVLQTCGVLESRLKSYILIWKSADRETW